MGLPFFGGLRGGKDLSAEAAGKAITTLTPSLDGRSFAPTWQPLNQWDIAKAVQQGYGASVWVMAGTRLLANNQARRRLRFRDPREAADSPGAYVDDDHPLLALLNPGGSQPNPREKARGFRARLSKQLVLSPRGVFVQVVNSAAGLVAGMDLLPPGRTTPVLADDGTIFKYKVISDQWGQPPTFLEPDEVLWIRGDEHPTDPLGGITPLMAAGISIEIDLAAGIHNRKFLQNDARPGIVIGIKPPSGDDEGLPVDPADLAELDRKLERGPMSAGKPMFVDGSLSVVDLSGQPRDGQYKFLGETVRDKILIALGTPLSMLGIATDATFSNGDRDSLNYWFGAQANHDSVWLSTFDSLVPDGLVLELSTADVPELAALQATRRAEMRQEVASGQRSILSYQREAGLQDEVDVPGTRALWFPAGSIAISATPEDQVAVDKLTPIGAATQAAPMRAGAVGNGATAAVTGKTLQIAGREPETGGKAASTPSNTEDDPDPAAKASAALAIALAAVLAALEAGKVTAAALTAAVDAAEAAVWATLLAPAADTYSNAESDDLLAPPADNDQSNHTAIELTAIAALAAAILLRPKIVPRIPGVPLPKLIAKLSGARKGDKPANKIPAKVTPVPANATAVPAALVLNAAEAIRKALRDRYAQDTKRSGISAWAGLTAELAARQVIETVRAQAALNAIARGATLDFKWRTRGDKHVRPTHRTLNNRTAHPGDTFMKGMTLRWPHDPRAPIEETAGCRCSLSYVKAAKKVSAPIPALVREPAMAGVGKALNLGDPIRGVLAG